MFKQDYMAKRGLFGAAYAAMAVGVASFIRPAFRPSNTPPKALPKQQSQPKQRVRNHVNLAHNQSIRKLFRAQRTRDFVVARPDQVAKYKNANGTDAAARW